MFTVPNLFPGTQLTNVQDTEEGSQTVATEPLNSLLTAHVHELLRSISVDYRAVQILSIYILDSK